MILRREEDFKDPFRFSITAEVKESYWALDYRKDTQSFYDAHDHTDREIEEDYCWLLNKAEDDPVQVHDYQVRESEKGITELIRNKYYLDALARASKVLDTAIRRHNMTYHGLIKREAWPDRNMVFELTQDKEAFHKWCLQEDAVERSDFSVLRTPHVDGFFEKVNRYPSQLVTGYYLFLDEDKVVVSRAAIKAGKTRAGWNYETQSRRDEKTWTKNIAERYVFKYDPQRNCFRYWHRDSKGNVRELRLVQGELPLSHSIENTTMIHHPVNNIFDAIDPWRLYSVRWWFNARREMDKLAQKYGFKDAFHGMYPWSSYMERPEQLIPVFGDSNLAHNLMLGNKDLPSVARRLVGNKYPKDVTKAIAKVLLTQDDDYDNRAVILNRLPLAKSVFIPNLRDIVNITMKKQGNNSAIVAVNRDRMEMLLRKVPANRRFRVLFSPLRHSSQDFSIMVKEIRDARKQGVMAWDQLDFSDVKDWHDVHERLSMARRRLWKAERTIDPEFFEGYPKKVGDISVIIPTSNYEVEGWGDAQGHCIGTYANNCVQGLTHLVGFSRKGEWVAHAQITDQRFVQMYARFNKQVNDHDAWIILHGLHEAGVLSKAGSWNIYNKLKELPEAPAIEAEEEKATIEEADGFW